MATKLTSDSFLTVVRQSQLVEQEQLKKFLKGLEHEGKSPESPQAMADELISKSLLTSWQAEKLLAGKSRGFFLGKYRLLSHLGTGGMSSVYLAEHVLMRRRVAIKVLPQARVEDSSYLERFHREAQAVAALDHPNIVRAYDVDKEGTVHFLVMEYVTGQSLQDMVAKNGPMRFVDAADYMGQAADGLHSAHLAGMVHRDIKPGNLLVDKKGVVKLLDLGLAMFFEEKEDNPLTIRHDEKVLGTADYLSPEQALDSHTVDIRADIYSLGCTLYYMLTGHPPFPDGTLAQRLLAHQTRQPESVQKDRPDTPESLMTILQKMMEKKPADRYQTAKETSEALSRWLGEHGDTDWRERNPYLASTNSVSGTGSGVLNGPGSGKSAPPAAVAAPPAVPAVPVAAMPVAVAAAPPPAVAAPVVPIAAVPVAPAPVSSAPVSPPAAVFPSFPGAAEASAQGGSGDDNELTSFFATLDAPAPKSKPQSAPKVVSSKPAEKPAPAPVIAAPAAARPEIPSFENLSVPEPAAKAAAPVAAAPAATTPVATAPVAPAKPAAPVVSVPTGSAAPPIVAAAPAAAVPVSAVPAAPAVQVAKPAVAVAVPQTAPVAPIPAQPIQVPPVAAAVVAPQATPALQSPGAEPAFPAFPGPAAQAAPAFAAPAAVVSAAFPGEPGSPAAPPPAPPKKKKRRGKQNPLKKLLEDPRVLKWGKIAAAAILAIVVLWGSWSAIAGFFGTSEPATASKGTKKTRKPKPKTTAATEKDEAPVEEEAPAPGPRRKKGTVSQRKLEVGPGKKFANISAALADAKAHGGEMSSKPSAWQTITIVGGREYPERIRVDETHSGVRLKVEGGDITLNPADPGPVIELNGVNKFMMEGFRIKAEGKETGIQVSGYSKQVELRRFEITGFAKQGILARGPVGFGSQPLIIEDFTLRPGAATAVGMSLLPEKFDPSQIVITQGKFFGPMANGVLFDSNANDVTISRCIFDQTGVGVRLTGAGRNLRRVRFVNNTFYKMPHGIIFSEMPGSLTDGLGFYNNLFAEVTNFEVFIEKGLDSTVFGGMLDTVGSGASYNMTSRPGPPPPPTPPPVTEPPKTPPEPVKPLPVTGEFSIFEAYGKRGVTDFKFASVDPSQPQFLAPSPDSPQRTSGLGTQTAKPWIGAVGPK